MTQRKLNILLLNWRDIRHPKAGGAEIVTMEHTKGWVKKGHTVTWLTSRYKGSKKDEIIDGVYIMRRSGSLFIYLWGFFYTLLYGFHYDVIIDEIHALPFLTPLATKTPKIAFIHEVAGKIWDYMAPFPISAFGKMFERIYFPLYKSVVFWTDSYSTIEELQQMGISKSNCVEIPCPIHKKEIRDITKKENNPTFIFVSRVVAMKGIQDVIDSFTYILKELPSAQLLIVGSGEVRYVNSLKKYIHDLGIEQHIRFLGKLDEDLKLALMKQSHILLHASVKEGWGLVVLEAASQGTPSVVYNVPGLKDVVKHNKTGFIVNQNVPKHLAKAALELYKDAGRYKRYQAEGKKWVDSLKWDEVISKSELLLQTVVSRK